MMHPRRAARTIVGVCVLATRLTAAQSPRAADPQVGSWVRRGEVRAPHTGAPVVYYERVVQSLDDRGTLVTIVEVRCHDVVPRGGSDCADLGDYGSRWEVRAYDATHDTPRWTVPLDRALGRPVAMRGTADVVRVDFARRHVTLARADGSMR